MDIVKNEYKKAYKIHGKAKESLFIPKGRQIERFEILTNHIEKNNFSLLDFGCGFGDLRNFLKNKYDKFTYLGVDIVDDFIRENKEVSTEEFLLIEHVKDIQGTFDYICISGAFNMSYFKDDIEKHTLYVIEILDKLFSENLTEKGVLSVDFMHNEVDFIQDGAYHIDICNMYTILREKLSNRISFNKSIFPYEVTFTIYKNKEIDRGSNLYER